MAFPESSIDSIVVAGENVMLKPSYGIGSNVRVPTTTGNYPAQAVDRPARKPIDVQTHKPSPIEVDKKTGQAFYRPLGNSPAKNKREWKVSGNTVVWQNNQNTVGDGEFRYAGATPFGNRHVIGGITPRRGSGPPRTPAPTAVSLRKRDFRNDPYQPPTPVDPEQANQANQGNQEN